MSDTTVCCYDQPDVLERLVTHVCLAAHAQAISVPTPFQRSVFQVSLCLQ